MFVKTEESIWLCHALIKIIKVVHYWMIVMLINLSVTVYYLSKSHLQIVSIHKLENQYAYNQRWIVSSLIQNVKQYQKINVNIS